MAPFSFSFSLSSNRRGFVMLFSIHQVVGNDLVVCVAVEEVRELKPPLTRFLHSATQSNMDNF
jgi:hypothetical protein